MRTLLSSLSTSPPPKMECFCGVVQFISCLYVLPVVPFQMKRVGYDETASIVATTVTCAIGSIASSFLTDMPLIIAPPTSVSIFLAVSMQQANFDKDMGCASVILSGAGLVVIGALPPVARFISKVCVFFCLWLFSFITLSFPLLPPRS